MTLIDDIHIDCDGMLLIDMKIYDRYDLIWKKKLFVFCLKYNTLVFNIKLTEKEYKWILKPQWIKIKSSTE